MLAVCVFIPTEQQFGVSSVSVYCHRITVWCSLVLVLCLFILTELNEVLDSVEGALLTAVHTNPDVWSPFISSVSVRFFTVHRRYWLFYKLLCWFYRQIGIGWTCFQWVTLWVACCFSIEWFGYFIIIHISYPLDYYCDTSLDFKFEGFNLQL